MEVIAVSEDKSRLREVDAATARSRLRSALESVNLTPEELLLGKVDEDGEIVWSGCPRWLRDHPRTLPTVDGIVDEACGPEPAGNSGGNGD